MTKNPPKNLVVIPAARYVEQEMQIEVGRIAPVLIPINNRPILELIVERFSALPGGCLFALAVHEGVEQIEAYLDRHGARDSVRIFRVGQTKDLAETIENVLSQFSLNEFDNLYINFGDTLIEAPLENSSDAIFYDVIHESYRWTTFQDSASGLQILDKFSTDFASVQSVFTGLFLFKEAARFSTVLHKARAQENLGRFYAALKEYLRPGAYALIHVTEWFDFGHVDNYFHSKKRFINKRYFNQIKIDEHRAVLEKRSDHLQKFYGEIKWYLEIPSGLRCYLPQVYDYSLCGDESFISLEYYSYPPLSDLYTVGGYTLGTWNHVFGAVFMLIDEMKRYGLKAGRDEIRAALSSMYLTKTLERIRMLEADEKIAPYLRTDLEINGHRHPALLGSLEHLPELVDRLLIDTLDEFSIIHGDMCLSNILFDPKSRIIKLVDPRGQFGTQTIYGDFRYDLAKLSHSFHGHYELIISDSFSIRAESTSIEYEVFVTEQQKILEASFNAEIGKRFPESISAMRAIEALLFLAMVPLHRDYPKRQITMLATGIEQYHAVLGEAGITD